MPTPTRHPSAIRARTTPTPAPAEDTGRRRLPVTHSSSPPDHAPHHHPRPERSPSHATRRRHKTDGE